MLLKYYPKPAPVATYSPPVVERGGWLDRWTGSRSVADAFTEGKHVFNQSVKDTSSKYPIGSDIKYSFNRTGTIIEHLEMRGLCSKNIMHDQYNFVKVKPLDANRHGEIHHICPKEIIGFTDVVTTLPTTC